MKIKYTKIQIALEIITILLLLTMLLNLNLSWSNVADKIPGHYNAAGQVDRWGHKSELLFVPIMSAVLYVLVTVIGFFPALWNVPMAITEQNRNKLYNCMRDMICVLKLEMVLTFLYISYESIKVKQLSPYFTLISLGGIAVTITYFIVRMYQISKIKA